MSRKLPTLLKINAMMKQKAEQQYAELIRERTRISTEISNIEVKVSDAEMQLFSARECHSIQTDFQTFETWRAAKYIHVQNLLKADEALAEKQKVLKAELSQLIVRETQLATILRKESHREKVRRETLQSEETQNIWLRLS